MSYVRDGKVDKGIAQFETAVKLQPGYVTAWNNLGDAFESKKDYKSALMAFEEILLFDPNNKGADGVFTCENSFIFLNGHFRALLK